MHMVPIDEVMKNHSVDNKLEEFNPASFVHAVLYSHDSRNSLFSLL